MSNRRKVHKQPSAVWLYRHTIKSAAWQALSVGARAIYVELAANYNTKMQNAVYLSARTGAEKLGVNKKMIVKWLRELQHYGFIALVERGTIGVYGYGKATQFRLTDRPYAGKSATHTFQNWTGELFNPEPDGGRNWQPKKQNPVPQEGTPRTPGRDIEKSGRASSLCTPGRDIETATDRTPGRDITSLASYKRSKGDVATTCSEAAHPLALPSQVLSGLRIWTMPVLTEIPYTAKLYKPHCEAVPAGIGHNAGPPLTPADDNLDIPAFLRR
jgi:hypothetical protein